MHAHRINADEHHEGQQPDARGIPGDDGRGDCICYAIHAMHVIFVMVMVIEMPTLTFRPRTESTYSLAISRATNITPELVRFEAPKAPQPPAPPGPWSPMLWVLFAVTEGGNGRGICEGTPSAFEAIDGGDCGERAWLCGCAWAPTFGSRSAAPPASVAVSTSTDVAASGESGEGELGSLPIPSPTPPRPDEGVGSTDAGRDCAPPTPIPPAPPSASARGVVGCEMFTVGTTTTGKPPHSSLDASAFTKLLACRSAVANEFVTVASIEFVVRDFGEEEAEAAAVEDDPRGSPGTTSRSMRSKISSRDISSSQWVK